MRDIRAGTAGRHQHVKPLTKAQLAKLPPRVQRALRGNATGEERARNLRLIRMYERDPNPSMPRPGLHDALRLGQSALETLGLGGAAHPIRKAQHIREGGPMIVPWLAGCPVGG